MIQDSTHYDEISQSDVSAKITAFQEARVLLTACELGVFDCLHIYDKTVKEMAQELGVSERGLEKLLDALVGMEFLYKNKRAYTNAPSALAYLVKQSADYIGGVGHWNNLWEQWSNMTEAVKVGHALNPTIGADETRTRAFIAAMHWRAQRNALELIANFDLSKVFKMIDIGGGSGAYSFEFARARPGLKSVVFDLPNVIEITKEYIETERLSRKISTLAGDFNKDDIGSGYDLAFVSAIVHINSIEDNFALFEKIYTSLNRGGSVVVQDFTVNIERTEPRHSSLFALNMFLGTEEGNVYTQTEIIMMIKNAMFSDVHSFNTPFGTTVFVGRK